ncbi:DUF4783 domain-containing protein [Paludibacter sp. 221]|uniref:DUF4783 domain-containing protein n=1 Tax=Paludibacter sp. 221 TaxID=2302939 RepID=UPI0013D0350D|nr:DUF4783 domain-containing protein [Paludibacter sp. 221]NDV47132.1 DUF4783 domain-containing protein [Paludibacter sp. 221]
MKKSLSLLFSLFIIAGTLTAYSRTMDVPSEIINALGKGDASTISTYLNTNVELVIDNKNDIFSKQQAESIITDFFRRSPVKKFDLIHKGEKESASFAIGTLRTTNGNFRVYVLTRKNGSKDAIQQLRIEPSND